jgi:hypothetical protein
MKTDVLTDDRFSREREFHDRLAAQFDPAEMLPKRLGPLEQAMLERAGDLRGRRVLDLGCESGDRWRPSSRMLRALDRSIWRSMPWMRKFS